MKLTIMEIKILNAMRTNEYNDALSSYPCGTWSFTAIDNSGIPAKKARGVISSLVKKGLVTISGRNTRNAEDCEAIGFTELGCKLFDTATGEKCNWDECPQLLLKESDEIEQPQTKEPAPSSKSSATMVVVTLATLCDELKIDSKKARRILRDSDIKKTGKSWECKTQTQYNEMKALLSK